MKWVSISKCLRGNEYYEIRAKPNVTKYNQMMKTESSSEVINGGERPPHSAK